MPATLSPLGPLIVAVCPSQVMESFTLVTNRLRSVRAHCLDLAGPPVAMDHAHDIAFVPGPGRRPWCLRMLRSVIDSPNTHSPVF